VGWYTFGKAPTPWHAKVQLQLQQQFECDLPIFMLYHWDRLAVMTVGGKLPFTLYESFSAQESGGMDVDGVDESHAIKFRPLSYSLETAEDEAIGLADIVQSATAATAVQQSSKLARTESSVAAEAKGKGKSTAKQESEKEDATEHLTSEEEDSK
jgi:hypothetical protein